MFAALILAGITVVSACHTSAGAHTSVPPVSGVSKSAARQPDWLISSATLNLLSGAGMSTAELSADFDRSGVYLITGAHRGTGYSNTVGTQSFTSVTMLQSALGHGLDPAVHAVLYDDEAWPLTPTAEQRDPAVAESRAAALTHAHHLQLIAAPATDLTRVLAPGESGYAAYLRLGLSATAAKAADVIDIQAQGGEADTAKYADFVRQAAAAAHAANPRVVVLAGISTNPSGQHVTAERLRAAIDATRGSVDGYWLNVPQSGKACPHCGTAQPQVAVTLLRELTATH
jgi:hypothetical protein